MRTDNTAIFLTGATGFLGSALLRALLAADRQVFATVREHSNCDRIANLIHNPRLELINVQTDSLEAVFNRRSIGTIIHAATEYGRGETPLATILEANLLLPVRLAELGIKYGSNAFINIDSFFNKNRGSRSNLVNYSQSKLELLDWLERLSPKIRVVNAMLEHMYGPGDSRTKFIEAMIQDIAVAKVPSIDLTHGHQRRDFIYLTDVVSAILAILDHLVGSPVRFQTIGIGTGQETQVRDMVSLIASASESPTELRFGAVPYRSEEIMGSHADVEALHALGWQARVTPAEGVRMILDSYRQAGQS